MRKILLVMFVFFISSYGYSQITNTITERIYPKATFTGMTKNSTSGSNVYAKQSVDKDPKTFFIGYDQNKKIYGAGYLEFDLSKIPKGATIDKAELQLTSALSNPIDVNFNGSIMLHQCSSFSDANQTTWSMLTDAVGGSNTAVLNVNLQKEGLGYRFTTDFLKAVVKDRIGSRLYLAMNKSDANKIVRINGDQKDLYLEVIHTTKTDGSIIIPPDGGSSHPDSIDNYGFSRVYSGDSQMFSYHMPNHLAVYANLKWIYDENLFQKVENPSHDYRSITLKAKDVLDKQDTYIKVETYGEESASIKITVNPEVLIIASEDKICGGNTSLQYTIKNVPIDDGATINWQSTPTMTLISGQGTPTATYRFSISQGNGTVRAIFFCEGKSYLRENTIFINNYNLFPSYAFNFTNGDGMGSWSTQSTCNSFVFRSEDLDGYFDLGVFTHYELYVTDLKGREKFRRTRIFPGNPVPWLPEGWYICYVRGYTACGVTNWHEQEVEVVSDNGGGELFPFSLKASPDNGIIAPPVSISTPVTVKVYTFNTGTLVYSEKNVIDFNIQNTTLKDGIYVVVTTDQNGETKSEKVAKTRN